MISGDKIFKLFGWVLDEGIDQLDCIPCRLCSTSEITKYEIFGLGILERLTPTPLCTLTFQHNKNGLNRCI